MLARVFISCGQATAAERKAARAVERWFKAKGFKAYVAIQSQSLADVNSGIIGELKRADYYVFIDFRREKLTPKSSRQLRQPSYRGSLFTNQELAIAFFLQFEHVIFLQQKSVELNGLLRYMGSNAERFTKLDQVLPLVKKLVTARGWHTSYTRHLAVGRKRWSEPIRYGDHTGQRHVRAFYVDVHNRRPELGALSAVARLERIVKPDGTVETDIDRSSLKVTGQPGYSQVIWPESYATWDCLAVSMDESSKVYLNSALDLIPRKPIISETGEYLLGYEVFAENFPVLRFGIQLSVNTDPRTTSATLVDSPAQTNK